MNNNPQIINSEEWKEIVDCEDVRATWAIDDDFSEYYNITANGFSKVVFGCKFDYVSKQGYGYSGDVFCLYGDNLDSPMTLIRGLDDKLKTLI